MAFKWAQYLTVADKLISMGDEASCRASVSRAYYAVYGEAKEFLVWEGAQLPKHGSVHAAVIEKFTKSKSLNRRDLGFKMNKLKWQRVQADYKSDVI